LGKASDLKPDVIIIDVTTPKGDWPKVIALIRSSLPQVKVLAFSLSENEVSLLEAVKAGANGYLPVNFTASQAKRMIRAVSISQQTVI
jgi:DNA-binding NarL/FixJ family response regulator